MTFHNAAIPVLPCNSPVEADGNAPLLSLSDTKALLFNSALIGSKPPDQAGSSGDKYV
jgi:hypothetical protein